MVEEPVMANTVHINTISLYQGSVHRSGMGFGPMYHWKKDASRDVDSAASLVEDEDDSTAAFVVFLEVTLGISLEEENNRCLK